jgi:hypothetical protein
MNTCRAVAVFALLSLAGSALAASNPMDNQKTNPAAGVTCKEALQNVKELKVGLTEHRVLQLLGNPKSKTANQWAYSFWECVACHCVQSIARAHRARESVAKEIRRRCLARTPDAAASSAAASHQ